MTKVKVRALVGFTDRKDNSFRYQNDVFETTPERAKAFVNYIDENGNHTPLAEIIDENQREDILSKFVDSNTSEDKENKKDLMELERKKLDKIAIEKGIKDELIKKAKTKSDIIKLIEEVK